MDKNKYRIDYNSFYGSAGLHNYLAINYYNPSTAVFCNERKKLFLKNLKKLEQKKKKLEVLDVGCGSGRALFELFRHETKENRYFGIDLNKECIQFAKDYSSSKLPPRFHFEILNIAQKGWSKLLNRKFDLIIFSEVIEHIYSQDQKIVLEELCNLVSDEGIIIITCPNKSCFIKRAIKFCGKIPLLKNYINSLGEFKGILGHVGEPSYLELKKIVKDFKIIKQGGLTFIYGHEKIGDSTFLMISMLLLNKIFGLFLPFWAFDQYIILKKTL